MADWEGAAHHDDHVAFGCGSSWCIECERECRPERDSHCTCCRQAVGFVEIDTYDEALVVQLAPIAGLAAAREFLAALRNA